MANDGKDYERFVQNLQQALLDSEELTKQKNIKIEANKKITDNNGIEREFDLYWEYELAGITYKTIIECKDYNSCVSIEKIDALIGKLRDIPDVKGIFATKRGYQKGAKIKAEKNKIDLLIVREQNDSDWQDEEGNSYIKKIGINMIVSFPAQIINFSPFLDGKWVKENTDLDVSKPLNFCLNNDRILIEDIEKGEKYSLLELENKLRQIHRGEFGTFTKEEQFANAYISYEDKRLKLLSFTADYVIRKPMSLPMNIDLSKELVGIIEYLHKGSKTAVYLDRIIKDWQ